MEKFSEWLSSKFENPLIPMFFFLGVLLLLLGVSNGLNLPILNQIVSDANFRWICLVLGVLCLVISIFIYYRLPKDSGRSNKKDFWQILLGKHPKEYIYVVPSAKQGFEWEKGKPIRKPGHTALLSYNEVIAFFRLQNALPKIKERLILVHGDAEFPDDKTLIIIGSSNANKVCKRILSSPEIPQLPFRFGTNKKGKCINLYQNETGGWSKKPLESFPPLPLTNNPNSTTDKKIEKDFGIILRVTNPRDADHKNKVLIVGGNHGFGTESAVNFVVDKNRVKFLTDTVQDQDFEALFQAAVNAQQGLGLGIRKLAVLKNGVWIPIPIA